MVVYLIERWYGTDRYRQVNITASKEKAEEAIAEADKDRNLTVSYTAYKLEDFDENKA